MTNVPNEADDPDFGIIYFGNDWFAENRTSSHHIARRLAGKAKLLYVDCPGMRPPTASGRDLSRIWRKLAQTARRAVWIAPGLWHCTMPQLPWRRMPGAQALNRWFGGWVVRRAMRQAGIRRALLWFVVPHPAFMLDAVPHVAAIYYCIDDYAAHPGVDVQAIADCDEALSRRADHVFVAPPALLPLKQHLNPHCSFSPHGVDVELFARAQSADTALPTQAALLGRPVIGYFGLIAAWTNVDLIEWLALQRPQWSFLLVGHAHVDVSALRKLSNVALVGTQPYESLPGWAKAFDVAIIPYRLNRQVKNANPLKLREYLATGKPVVTVRTPEVDRFAELVSIVDTNEEFLAAIEKALVEVDPQASQRRMTAVQSMSWDRRVTETWKVVREVLAIKAPASK